MIVTLNRLITAPGTLSRLAAQMTRASYAGDIETSHWSRVLSTVSLAQREVFFLVANTRQANQLPSHSSVLPYCQQHRLCAERDLVRLPCLPFLSPLHQGLTGYLELDFSQCFLSDGSAFASVTGSILSST